jgi:hypothetical protein
MNDINPETVPEDSNPVMGKSLIPPTTGVRERCDACKDAMGDIIAVLKQDFNISDEELESLQTKVREAVEAVRPSDEEIEKMSPAESNHRYGMALAHYALLTYSSAGTFKNALGEPREPTLEPKIEGATDEQNG